MKYLIIFIVYIFVSLETVAQSSSDLSDSLSTITGIVVDFTTKEPMVATNVILDGTILGAACDLDGKFEILNVPPGDYTIKASMIGYNPAEQQISIKPGSSIGIIIELPDDIEYWARKAEEDIVNGNIQFLVGGLVIIDPVADEAAKKFNFKYNLMGCDFITGKSYNTKMEQYLEKTYGPNWRKKFEKEKERIRAEYKNK